MKAMGCSPEANSRVSGTFGLVSYIPGPLGSFLNRLRSQLVPGRRLQSHITILPPRVLHSQPEELSAELDSIVPRIQAFKASLGEVEIFPETDVIYLGVRAGWQEMLHAHGLLSEGMLHFKEPYPFHPHVTLAQNIAPENVAETLAQARSGWSEWWAERSFAVDELAFVRNVDPNTWELLSAHPLNSIELLRTA
jgi:2'-5' RNA ligase